jgi:1-deoxy-D-xylulose-5-phosphate synthase
LIALGGRLKDTVDAAKILAEQENIRPTVIDARFAKPLDSALLLNIARHHKAVVTIEEGSTGGFGASVLHLYAQHGVLDSGLKIRTMTLPDVFQDQDTPENMIKEAGLDAWSIAQTGLQLVQGTTAKKLIASI